MLFKRCKHEFSKVIGQEYFDSFNCAFYHYRECGKCGKHKRFIGRIKPANDVLCNSCGLHMVMETQTDFNPCDMTTEYYCANCGTTAKFTKKRGKKDGESRL